MTDTQQETYASKIEKLLRRAEHPNTPAEEADACIAKAQELMVTYAIDEEMINRARGIVVDKIIEDRVHFGGSYQMALFDVGRAVATANGLRTMISKNISIGGKPHTRLYLVGFESDVRRAKMLISSVEIQCAVAMKAFWKENRATYAHLTGMGQYKVKRDFIFGFALGLQQRLNEANRAAKAEAAKHEAVRADVTEKAASDSVALVLTDRKEQVKDWFDTTYGKKLRSVSRNYASGAAGGRAAGVQAGRNADLGTGRVGSQKAIG